MDKPNIEDVYSAFHKFHFTSVAALSKNYVERGAALQAARQELHDHLEHLGLAQHIDWTDKNAA